MNAWVAIFAAGLLAANHVSVAAGANPFAGRQEAEKVCEFTAEPKVESRGDTFVITFVSKASCDATVAIVDEGGKSVRHLASAVLGENAPAPSLTNRG